MTEQEFAKFAMGLKTYYPRENLLPNRPAVELWYRQLQDLPYDVAEAALNKWVSTNKWSPSIAEIRQMCCEVRQGEISAWSEAWETVLHAIRIYGSYRPQDAMFTFDDLTARTVKQIGGFVSICRSENIDIDRANFRMVYEELAKRKQKDALMPARLRSAIQRIQSRGQMMLEGRHDDEEI